MNLSYIPKIYRDEQDSRDGWLLTAVKGTIPDANSRLLAGEQGDADSPGAWLTDIPISLWLAEGAPRASLCPNHRHSASAAPTAQAADPDSQAPEPRHS